MIAAIFKSAKRSTKSVQSGIKREQFILLINLGYDKFTSAGDEIEDFVQEGNFQILRIRA